MSLRKITQLVEASGGSVDRGYAPRTYYLRLPTDDLYCLSPFRKRWVIEDVTAGGVDPRIVAMGRLADLVGPFELELDLRRDCPTTYELRHPTLKSQDHVFGSKGRPGCRVCWAVLQTF